MTPAPDALDRRRPDLTAAQTRALRYLNDKMYATGADIGRAILRDYPSAPRASYIASGAKVMSDLRWRRPEPFVIYLPDVFGWRITAAGRKALQEAAE